MPEAIQKGMYSSYHAVKPCQYALHLCSWSKQSKPYWHGFTGCIILSTEYMYTTGKIPWSNDHF